VDRPITLARPPGVLAVTTSGHPARLVVTAAGERAPLELGPHRTAYVGLEYLLGRTYRVLGDLDMDGTARIGVQPWAGSVGDVWPH
jgi:hypothetical protein